jgi:hypothetical protein
VSSRFQFPQPCVRAEVSRLVPWSRKAAATAPSGVPAAGLPSGLVGCDGGSRGPEADRRGGWGPAGPLRGFDSRLDFVFFRREGVTMCQV